MAGLFTAYHGAQAQHFLQDVTVPHGGAHQTNAETLQGNFQTQVRHHGADHYTGSTLKITEPAQEVKDVVSVSAHTAAVHKHGAIRIAVESHPQIRFEVQDFLLEPLDVQGSGLAVDIVSVRLAVEGPNLGSERAKEFGRNGGERAVSAIYHEANAFKTAARGNALTHKGRVQPAVFRNACEQRRSSGGRFWRRCQ